MEFKRRSNKRWFQNIVKFMVFGLFTANAHAQILFGPPSFVVQPVGIGVQNGGTAILATSAASTPLPIKSVTWYLNGKAINSSNAGILTVNLGVSATSTLTITNFSTANAGNYTVTVVNTSGSVTSSNATAIIVTSLVTNVLGLFPPPPA